MQYSAFRALARVHRSGFPHFRTGTSAPPRLRRSRPTRFHVLRSACRMPHYLPHLPEEEERRSAVSTRSFGRVLALICALMCLFCLVSCDKYPEKKSSAKERTVIADVGSHEVTYALYRALYHTCRSAVDGGDESVWTGDEAATYRARLQQMIEEQYKELFGTFELADACNIDPYGRGIDDLVSEYVRVEIEGGTYSGAEVAGYGSRDAYLQALEDAHFTDAVHRLFLRRQACLERITAYYRDTFADGTVAQDEATARAFYESDDCLRFLWVRREKTDGFDQKAWMQEALGVLEACPTYAQRREQMILYGYNLSPDDAERGIFITTATADPVYETIVEALSGMEEGQLSNVIETYEGYYILMKLPKETSLPDDPDVLYDLSRLYTEHCLYTRLAQIVSSMTVSYRAAFDKYRDGPDD